MISAEHIIDFLKPYQDGRTIKPDADLYQEAGITGDDFQEMIEAYADKFQVNMSEYRWYFHTNEDGISIGSFFFAPPYSRVHRMPVTPAMLAQFANARKWEINYPPHQLPEKRYDLLINTLLTWLFLLLVLLVLVAKLFIWLSTHA